MTGRLYYTDSYLTEFQASVIEKADEGRRVYLDHTAFYPASGGQPHDTGLLAGVPVVEVVDEDSRIAHVTAAPVPPGPAVCRIDWPRRFDHMQQHTGQHLLSAVLAKLHDATTVGFHLGAESSLIDVAVSELSEAKLAAIEAYANSVVCENRSVSVAFEDAERAAGLRKPSARDGALRIVTIEGLDRSACGGTHVRATGEIGPILIRKLDRAHGNLRLEFLCGARAVRRARADFLALSAIARTFSSALDDAPELAAAQARALEASGKARRKLAAELAALRGRELYAATPANALGLHSAAEQAAALDEDVRAKAQGFTAGTKACYLAVTGAAVLLAVSQDADLHAGNVLKQAVAKFGGRGGGSPLMAQASIPSPESLAPLLDALRAAIGLP
ncbi:MAG TPA: DHHA1 domain-containing protein [Bryobacteraceae bacterium]